MGASLLSSASSSTGAGNVIKEQMKQKEQEATEILRNYRGQPEDFMSHQVKKHSSATKNDNYNANANAYTQQQQQQQADVVAPNPKEKKLGTVEGKFNPQICNEGDSNSVQSDRGRSASQGTNTDWSVISGNESNGSDSTAVNVDISEITGILNSNCNGPDAAAGGSSLNRSGYDTPSSASYVDASTEIERTGKQWKITNISVSFGLLMHENETPPEGTFSNPIQNDVVDNLFYKMRTIAERSLEKCVHAAVARQEESPLSIKVMKDASYKAPQNRPGVLRNLVKATIPIKTEKDDLQGVSNAKIMVHNTLRKSLSDLTSKS